MLLLGMLLGFWLLGFWLLGFCAPDCASGVALDGLLVEGELCVDGVLLLGGALCWLESCCATAQAADTSRTMVNRTLFRIRVEPP